MYSGELKYCTSMAQDFPAMVSFKIFDVEVHLDENLLKKIKQSKKQFKEINKD